MPPNACILQTETLSTFIYMKKSPTKGAESMALRPTAVRVRRSWASGGITRSAPPIAGATGSSPPTYAWPGRAFAISPNALTVDRRPHLGETWDALTTPLARVRYLRTVLDVLPGGSRAFCLSERRGWESNPLQAALQAAAGPVGFRVSGFQRSVEQTSIALM